MSARTKNYEKRTDVPGNAMASAQTYAKEMLKRGEKLTDFDGLLERLDDRMVYVHAIRFKAPTNEGGEWLGVVTATNEAGAVVGFHSAETLQETLIGIYNRLANGTFKFKEDMYANPGQDAKGRPG